MTGARKTTGKYGLAETYAQAGMFFPLDLNPALRQVCPSDTHVLTDNPIWKGLP